MQHAAQSLQDWITGRFRPLLILWLSIQEAIRYAATIVVLIVDPANTQRQLVPSED